jgi:hypothetical protein
MPLHRIALPEIELGGPIAGLKMVRLANIAQVFVIGLVLHSVLCKWFITIFHGEVFFGEPHIRLTTRDTQLAIEPPMPEAETAMLVQTPLEARGVEDPIQLRRLPVLAMNPPEHFGWGMPVVFTVSVCRNLAK